jgi:hypothetical protein
MEIALYVVAAGVLVAWLAFFLFARRWPLKVAERRVFCPIQQRPAKIRLVHSQVSFGSYMPSDLSSCSLLPRGPVSCHMECLKKAG